MKNFDKLMREALMDTPEVSLDYDKNMSQT